MITLADLKARSEQAQPILLKHYGLAPDQIFLAETGENFHGMSGGESPEWFEKTLLEMLAGHVQWGSRPATMTDEEWAAAVTITGVTPYTDEQIREMAEG